MIKDTNIVEQFGEYVCKNSVEDFIPDAVETILVCESPHTEEIKKGKPLVGPAGKAASKHLGIANNVGLGEYLDSNNICSIGIMNVCRAPLQKTTADKQSDFDFTKLETIRTGYKHIFRHRNPAINELEKYIVNDFGKRLKELKAYKNLTKIIVCGNFAVRYYCEAKPELESILLATLPHPARNGWSKCTEEQMAILIELKNNIQN